jgi:hypothetical protein
MFIQFIFGDLKNLFVLGKKTVVSAHRKLFCVLKTRCTVKPANVNRKAAFPMQCSIIVEIGTPQSEMNFGDYKKILQ